LRIRRDAGRGKKNAREEENEMVNNPPRETVSA